MTLIAQTERNIQLLNLGLELVDVRNRRLISLKKLAGYYGVTENKAFSAHTMALYHINSQSRYYTDEVGNRLVQYSVMSSFDGFKEPEFMSDAPTSLYEKEPEWMRNSPSGDEIELILNS